ncbi:MAG: 30S ribosome-binding factor RbfA [Tepidisphaerales bacterium]
MSRRTERLGSLLQQELSLIIQRELTDPRIMGFTSVTRVKVAEDLSVADVYLTIMGTPGQQTAALNAIRHSGGLMRTRLTKELSIRQVPYLKFHIDEQLKKELEVMRLLAQVKSEEAEMAERAAKLAAAQAAEAAAKAARAGEATPAGDPGVSGGGAAPSQDGGRRVSTDGQG